MEQVKKAFEQNNIAVILTSSDLYAPYVGVLIESIKKFASDNYNYDILVFQTDITQSNKDYIKEVQGNKSNFSVRFVDISEIMDGCEFTTMSKSHTKYNFYRLTALEVLPEYEKIIYLDSDLVLNNDIAELYNFNVEGYYLAACKCLRMLAHCNNPKPIGKMTVPMREYIENELGLKDYRDYFNSGVMLLNLDEMRKSFTSRQLIEISMTRTYATVEQDVLNVLCSGKVLYLPQEWNVLCAKGNGLEQNAPKEVYEEWLDAYKHPKIWHYVGGGAAIPCNCPTVDGANYFWKHAVNTPFMDLLIDRLVKKTEADTTAKLEKKRIAAEKAMQKKNAVAVSGSANKADDKSIFAAKPVSKPSVGAIESSSSSTQAKTVDSNIVNSPASQVKEGKFRRFVKKIMKSVLPAYRTNLRIEEKLNYIIQQKAISDAKENASAKVNTVQPPLVHTLPAWTKNTLTSDPTLYTSCFALEVHEAHEKAFSEFKNCHRGQSVAIIASGPSMKYYSQINNIPHIGMNASFMNPKVKLDYYFTTDYESHNPWFSKLKDYDFIKFFGQYSTGGYRDRFQVSEKLMLENNARRYFQGAPSDDIPLNIEYYPMMGYYSVAFQAVTFALYTYPKKIYLVGCDCSNNGYFNGEEQHSANPPKWIQGYKRLRQFARHFYPDTEIISINPIGLKGIFKDVYTEDFLNDNPGIDKNSVEIVDLNNLSE